MSREVNHESRVRSQEDLPNVIQRWWLGEWEGEREEETCWRDFGLSAAIPVGGRGSKMTNPSDQNNRSFSNSSKVGTRASVFNILRGDGATSKWQTDSLAVWEKGRESLAQGKRWNQETDRALPGEYRETQTLGAEPGECSQLKDRRNKKVGKGKQVLHLPTPKSRGP